MRKKRNVPGQVVGEGGERSEEEVPDAERSASDKELILVCRLVRSRFPEGELGGSFNSLDFGFHGVEEFVSK